MTPSDPLSVFLVSSGSRGDRLLFRYPYDSEEEKQISTKTLLRNPFAVRINEDYKKISWPSSNLTSTELIRYSDEVIGHLLAVKPSLCGQNFEIKINDVIFIGFPVTIHGNSFIEPSPKRESSGCVSFNVIFSLRGDVDRMVIKCYSDLTKQLAIALKHEEQRCGYFTQQKLAMWAIQDEISAEPEDSRDSPYAIMLQQSSLAKKLKAVYDGLCSAGVVQVHINRWVQISFCLPHKVHNVNLPEDVNCKITPEAIQTCIAALRPYHGMLLLVSEHSLLHSLPMDSSPALTRLISVTSPLKSLYQLSSDADLSLGQVYKLVIHLVYWGKATVIYPLCETNVYILSPNANTCVNSSLVEKFVTEFPGMSLPAIMSEFSLPTPMGEHTDVMGVPKYQVQMVIWLLKHRLLIQLHTYVFLMTSQSMSHGQVSPKVNGESTFNSETESSSKWTLGVASSSELSKSGSEPYSFTSSSSSIEASSEGSLVTEVAKAQRSQQEQSLAVSGLTQSQITRVISVPAAANTDDLKLFIRLCQYFTGRCHLEEIMYYENLLRSQLLTILDKFRDVLVTCQHEDPGITSWTLDNT